jgi:hypothetical protein
MKNAYGAINIGTFFNYSNNNYIDFDPSNQDVSSFMEVFGANKNDRISLEKLE